LIALIQTLGTNPNVPRTAIQKLEPDLLFVIAGEPEIYDLLVQHIETGVEWKPAADKLTFDDIEVVEVDAFNGDVLSTMLESIQKGMEWAKKHPKVGGGKVNFYVNLSGGANLMVVGSALAGVAIPELKLVYALDPGRNPGVPVEDLVWQMPMLSDLQRATDKINHSTPSRLRILRAVQTYPSGAVVADIANNLGISKWCKKHNIRQGDISHQRVAKVLGELNKYKVVDTSGGRNANWSVTEIGRLVLKINT
jgi:hypothetical protein